MAVSSPPGWNFGLAISAKKIDIIRTRLAKMFFWRGCRGVSFLFCRET